MKRLSVTTTIVNKLRLGFALGLVAAASLLRATTMIYPADAIDDFWNLNAEEFRQKYAGINVTGLGPSDEGWYVRYRHENLTCLFGPLAEREDARKRKWDMEAVRDAAIRNRASLATSQVDFVRFTFSGIYGKGGGREGTGAGTEGFPRVSPDGKYGPDGDLDGDGIPNRLDTDMNGNGIPNDQDNDSDGDGIPNDKDDYPFGPHPSTWGKPGVQVDEHGHAIGDGAGGDGQGAGSGIGKDGSGKGGSGKDGKGGLGDGSGDESGAIADGSAKGNGKGGKGGKGGRSGSQGGSELGDGSGDGSGGGGGQSGRQVASNQRGGRSGGGQGQGGQSGQSGQSGGSSGGGGQQGGQGGQSGAMGGQSGGGGGGGPPMGGGSSGGGGNPLSLITGLLRMILGL